MFLATLYQPTIARGRAGHGEVFKGLLTRYYQATLKNFNVSIEYQKGAEEMKQVSMVEEDSDWRGDLGW